MRGWAPVAQRTPKQERSPRSVLTVLTVSSRESPVTSASRNSAPKDWACWRMVSVSSLPLVWRTPG